jgi:hypothetical protein
MEPSEKDWMGIEGRMKRCAKQGCSMPSTSLGTRLRTYEENKKIRLWRGFRRG